MKRILPLSILLLLFLGIPDLTGQTKPGLEDEHGSRSIASSAPLPGGTYTIGGASPVFATFAAAAAKLNTDGVAGAVIFDVRPGTYAEAVTIRSVPGASAANSITFRAESGDSSSVTLASPAAIDTSNFTLRLITASYITFRNIGIISADTLRARTVILDRCANIRFEGSVIKGASLNGAFTPIIIDAIEPDSGIVVTGSLIRSGGTAIRIKSASTARPGIAITRNRFEALQDEGVFLTSMAAPIVTDNVIDVTSTSPSFTGLDLYLCPGATRVERNRLAIRARDGIGISLWGCNGTQGSAITVAGNMVGFEVNDQTSEKQWGILCYDSHYCSFLFNSVNLKFFISNPVGNNIGFSLLGTTPTNVTILNNIFATNSGHAMAIGASIDPTFVSDHNDLYSTSTTLALLGTEEILTLGQWQATTHRDASSLSVAPGFASTFDLHATTLALRGRGVTIPGIATDIDGDRRNPVSPDIGADERRPYRQDPAYVPFPSDRTDWRIGVCGLVCDTSRIWVRGDTTLNGMTYHKAYMTGDTVRFPAQGAQYMGGVREDSMRRVFILRPGLSRELLLYDFDAIAGDTLLVSGWTDTLRAHAVVSSVDSVLVDGAYRRRINLVGGPAESWIDGIGSTRHVLFPEADQLVTEFEARLFCFRVNGRQVYGDNCEDVSAGIDDDVVTGSAFRVTASRTAIDVVIPGSGGWTIELFDMSGRSVARLLSAGSGRVALDRPLATGAYIYRLKLESGRIIDGKVMVER
jgi:hypothetical protein